MKLFHALPNQASMFLMLTLCLTPACAHRQSQKTRIKTEEIKQAPNVISPWSSKKISDLSLDEAWSAYQYYKTNKRLPHLAATLERLILLTPDQTLLEPLITELSDLKISLGLYEEAETLLEEYRTLYPGNAKTPQRTLSLISILLKQNNSPERDLQKVEKALNLGYQLYEENKTTTSNLLSSEERQELVFSIQTAQKLILTKEINKIDFYITRYRYTQKISALRAAEKILEKLMGSLTKQPEPQLFSENQLKNSSKLLATLKNLQENEKTTIEERISLLVLLVAELKKELALA